MTIRFRPLVAMGVGLLAISTIASEAAAQSPAPGMQQCVEASEQAQKLRDEHKLQMARDQLLVCVRESCPAIVRKDCTDWLAGIESSLPSVVLRARDASGADLSAVRVTLDDKPLFDKLDGKSLFIDPGRHKFHFETEGRPPVDQEVVISEGEKNRAVTAVFGGGGGADGANVAVDTSQLDSSKRSFVLPIVFGALGVVALGSWGYFGLTGMSDYNGLESGCGKTKTCLQSDVDSVHTKFVVADVSLGIGVASLVVGGVLLVVQLSKKGGDEPTHAAFATPPKTTAKPKPLIPRFDVSPLPGGGLAGVHGMF
jgi:hypothetical protein